MQRNTLGYQHLEAPYKILLTRVVAAVAVSLVVTTGAPAREGGDRPKLSWRETETSVALLNHGKMVWEHVHDRKVGKPYMRIGLLDGTELTRPWPVPAGYVKADHVWHRALWWSWKILNGHNFWEENQQGTDPTEVKVTTTPEGAARIELTVAYHLPDQAPMLMEKRRIAVSQPDDAGNYFIDWHTTFTPANAKDVVFSKYRYGGLSIRMAGQFCGGGNTPAWTFLANTDEVTVNGTSVPTRWMAYQGSTSPDQSATVAILAHPDNPGSPPTWLVRDNYPYMNPTFPGQQDYTLQAGQSLHLRYRILVRQGLAPKADIEDAWQDFVQDRPQETQAVRFDPVVQQIEGWTVYVDPQRPKAQLVPCQTYIVDDTYFSV